MADRSKSGWPAMLRRAAGDASMDRLRCGLEISDLRAIGRFLFDGEDESEAGDPA